MAEYLHRREAQVAVGRTTPSLPSSPVARAGARSTGAGKGYGSVLAFQIEGGLEAGKRFVEALELHSHVANIGDVRSLVIHPASTTHSQLSQRGAAGLGRRTRAWSASASGLESIEDILADLDKGFAAAKA